MAGETRFTPGLDQRVNHVEPQPAPCMCLCSQFFLDWPHIPFSVSVSEWGPCCKIGGIVLFGLGSVHFSLYFQVETGRGALHRGIRVLQEFGEVGSETSKVLKVIRLWSGLSFFLFGHNQNGFGFPLGFPLKPAKGTLKNHTHTHTRQVVPLRERHHSCILICW